MATIDLDGLDGALASEPSGLIPLVEPQLAVDESAPAAPPVAVRRGGQPRLAVCAVLLVAGVTTGGVVGRHQHPRVAQPMPAAVIVATPPSATRVAAQVPTPSAPSLGAALVFPARFSFNDSAPDVDRASLQRLVATLATQCPTQPIAVTGYTCDRGSDSGNRRVGLERAVEVARLLAAAGLDRARLRVDSRGSADPIASNRTAQGRAANRRVVIACQR